MIALGSTEISKMYIGADEVDKIYLGSDLVYSSIPPIPLPYDAQVEYLIGTGSQYIETGIIPDADTGVKVKVTCSDSNDTFVFGCRNTSGNTRWGILHKSSFYYGYGNYGPTSTTNRVQGNYGIAALNFYNDKKCTITNHSGSTSYTYNLSTLSFSPSSNIRLFGSAGMVASYSTWSGYFYYAQITQGSQLVRDYIPVRVGQVGYMYDRVTNTLYGNNGSGSFTFGNDI